MKRITQLREQHKIKQADLAKHMGISQGTLSNWETGKHEPGNDHLQKLADYFGVSIDYLMERTVDPRPPQLQGALPETFIDLSDLPPTELEQVRKFVEYLRATSK